MTVKFKEGVQEKPKMLLFYICIYDCKTPNHGHLSVKSGLKDKNKLTCKRVWEVTIISGQTGEKEKRERVR